MKRMLSLILALSFTITMVSASDINPSDTTVETYALPQPINREIVVPNQMPQQQQPQADGTEYIYDDPYLSYQWAVTSTGADLAWETLDGDDSYSVVVAVVDTGVDYTHEDLENRVLWELGYDFVNDDDDPMDDNGHGTHVSGIIAAEADNGVGIAGIAGTLDVSILPIKALDADGAGEIEDIAAGILYAVEMEVDIINLSLGADMITPDVREAIEAALEADIFVVVASGNDGTVCAPLSLANLDGVFTVAAATESSTVADFSNYGDCVDGYAPGEDILSTYLDNQYVYQDGTSMAAPVVSGAVAVLLSQNSDLTNEELTALLTNTETKTTTTTNQTTTTQPTVNTSVTQITPTIPTTPMTPTTPIVPTTPIITPVITQPTIRMQAIQVPISYAPMSTSTTTCTVVNVYEALMNIA